MNIKLITVTWDNNDELDITKKTLYKSFKYFNPTKDLVHYHFNRGKYWQLEQEYHKKFGTQAEYVLFKITLLLEKIKTLDADYIIFCDANDVVCLKNVDYLINTFDLDNEVVIGMEKNQWPTPQSKSNWKNFKDYSPEDFQNRTFLNSGAILAKKKKYVELLESITNNIIKNNDVSFFTDGNGGSGGDQGVFLRHYVSENLPKIKLDKDSVFVVNTFMRGIDEYERPSDTNFVCKKTGIEPCFVHDNGWHHGSPKYVLNHELRRLYIPSYRHAKNISKHKPMPPSHQEYLFKLKNEFGFEPKVIWDIGACVLHWTTIAKEVWPNSEYFLFDAMEESEDLFEETCHNYHIGVLSDEDNKPVTFFKNATFPGGNSYYMENPKHSSMAQALFANPSNQFSRMAMTLNTVQKIKGFKMPDLLKLDVQGCELDILKGASEIIAHTKHLIVELQHVEYNIGAKLTEESIPIIESMGFKLVTPKFSSNQPDADYHFIKV